MAHDHHHHGHSHPSPSADSYLNKAFGWGIALNLLFVGVEFAAGLVLDSIALISDAGHNLSDVVSLALALLAFRLAKIKPSPNYTYGRRKSTILVSLANACILMAAIGIIIYESIAKLQNPQPIEGGAIAWVAAAGIVINAFTAWLFVRHKNSDLNVKGAYLHMAADALVSVGVVISGVIISFTGWYILDPVIGLVIAAVILFSTWGLLRDSVRLAMDGVPMGIDTREVERRIMESDGSVVSVHHIHIWAISTTENALTAHIVVEDMERTEEIKHKIKDSLSQLGIGHATLEFELPGNECIHGAGCGQRGEDCL